MSGRLAVDNTGEISGSGRNSGVTRSIDSKGNVEVRPLSFFELVREFFSPPITVDSDNGNVVIGKSVGGVGVKLEVDPASCTDEYPDGANIQRSDAAARVCSWPKN